MLTNYVFMICIKTETTEDVINIYLQHVYAALVVVHISLVIGVENFSSKQFIWLANELGFTKVYNSHYSPTGNLVIERMHSLLKASLQKIISNCATDLDSIAHISAMAYNVFPHSSTTEAHFYLMFGWDAYMPTIFKLLCQKLGMFEMKTVIYI